MSNIQERFLALADAAHASGRDHITVTPAECDEYAALTGSILRPPWWAMRGHLECLGYRVIITPQETE